MPETTSNTTYIYEIYNHWHKEPEMVGGLMEVYNDIPWVSKDVAKDVEGKEYVLIDSLEGQWSTGYYGMYEFSYINPSEILSVDEHTIYDADMTEYHYSEITIKDGTRGRKRKYYIADLWSAVQRRKEKSDAGSTDDQ